MQGELCESVAEALAGGEGSCCAPPPAPPDPMNCSATRRSPELSKLKACLFGVPVDVLAGPRADGELRQHQAGAVLVGHARQAR